MVLYRWRKQSDVLAVAWILLAAAVLGAPGSIRAQGSYQEVAVSNGGGIRGQVKLDGPIPEPYVIWVKKDAEVFGEKVLDERLLVSKDGKLENVVVMLESLAAGKAWPRITQSLENRGGRFVPHVQVARLGTELEIVNRDPVPHNTHGFQGSHSQTIFNVVQPNRDQKVRQRLRTSGIIEVMCDSHDWMNGWVVVLDHPYLAVTGKDGTFEITDVPPGTYKLTAWHEKLGRLDQQVIVAAGKTAQVGFTFRPAAETSGKGSGQAGPPASAGDDPREGQSQGGHGGAHQ